MATLNRSQAIPLADYAPGEYNLPETNFPNNATKFYLEIARCTTATPDIWPDPAVTLTLVLEFSTDNGASWREIAQGTFVGGLRVSRGSEVTSTTLQVGNLGTGAQRKIRGRAIVSGGPLRTQGFFEARN